MRQDWIEFKSKGGRNISLRPSNIMAIADKGDETWIYIDTELLGDDRVLSTNLCATTEPYEQVKQKIMDAEKVDLSDAVVEHFTKDEYQRLLVLAKSEQDGCREDNLQGQIEFMQNIIDKLNKILKEEE